MMAQSENYFIDEIVDYAHVSGETQTNTTLQLILIRKSPKPHNYLCSNKLNPCSPHLMLK